MRQKRITQNSIFWIRPEHEITRYFERINGWLEQAPVILDWLSADLDGSTTHGRPGMSCEQVLRAAIVMKYQDCSFRALEFLLIDSLSFQSFCRIDPFRAPGKSTLQKNIGAIRPATWRKINQVFIRHMNELGVESGDRLRIDSTVTESNILFPTDSKLLYDGIRLMVRVLRKTKSLTGIKFINHCRRAKRHWFAALMAKNDEQRFPHYIALLKDVDETRVSLKNAQRYLEKQGENALWVADIIQLMALIEKVMSQATRRVVLDEQVPVEDKVVSLHEPHTDIIVKGGRDVQFGHKINLATGVSGLVTDVVIEAGNPADRIRLLPMLKRHKKLYGQVPKEVAVDGGYASQKNLRRANLLGVEAMAFDKRVNLSIEDMVGDEWLYRDLKRFRAGIEASISYLKRCFGMKRVLWKGLTQFKASIYLSVLSHNLVRWASTI